MSLETPHIYISSLRKDYGNLTVIRDLDLGIAKGEFVSLLGPSGSGKTTLLMILAGFETPTSGAVAIDGKRIEKLPPYRRGLGVVFQNYALFPHMTVAENIAFPLKMRRMPRHEISSRTQKALDMVQLSAYGDRKPAQLSGGQQQRIALARALVFEPGVILMDEPFGALDKQLREQMQFDIRDMHRRLGLTIIFVTHDQVEALTMSDRIAVFNKGRIEQMASPFEIYERPATEFVAQFIGETNLIRGDVVSAGDDHATVKCGDELLQVRPRSGLRTGQSVALSLRPEKIRLVAERNAGQNCLAAEVRDTVYRGEHTRIDATTGIGELFVRQDHLQVEYRSGHGTNAVFAADDCWVIPA